MAASLQEKSRNLSINSLPLVSVITPVYNSEKFLTFSIESVLSQSYDNWELILVNDCSRDGSADIVDYFCNLDSRIIAINLEKNSGAAVARNAAIQACKGRFIAFLDSDDIWKANKLKFQIGYMLENKYHFTFSAYEKINEQGAVYESMGVPAKVNYKDLIMMPVIGCLTAIYDVDYFGKVYMPEIRKRQDLGLWLRLLKITNYAYGINESLAFYRVRQDSMTANKFTASIYTWKLLREVEKIDFFASLMIFSSYAIKGFFRTKFPNLARKLGWLK